eukprot:GHVU01147226.1.p3 GENE.GHVU01147226.1~~GHVU01147226.1.p3  ORF type:complete len:124 (+),score=15.68 GHVU01147226.1:234-605(+)
MDMSFLAFLASSPRSPTTDDAATVCVFQMNRIADHIRRRQQSPQKGKRANGQSGTQGQAKSGLAQKQPAQSEATKQAEEALATFDTWRTPALLWIMRDFVLSLTDEFGNPYSADEVWRQTSNG